MSQADLNELLKRALPEWRQAEFLFLEASPWWAPIVQAELSRAGPTVAARGSESVRFSCFAVPTTRGLYERAQRTAPTGLILPAAVPLRDSLLLLGRLGRSCREAPAVLVILRSDATSMEPLLLEAGATSVIAEPTTDRTIAAWCRRVASHR